MPTHLPAPLRRFLACLLIVGTCCSASAALRSYEGFGYTNGSNLNNAGGGSGFSANWLATSGVNATGTGLTWPNLPAGTAGAASIGSASHTTTYRTFADRSGTDTWVALLYRRDSADNGDTNVVIGSGSSGISSAPGTGGIRLGNSGAFARLTIGPTSQFAIGVNDPVLSDQQVGRTRLLLLHLDYSGLSSGTINVYLDPNLSQPLGSPNFSNSFSLASLDRIAFQGSTGCTVDEIRVGDIYQDVIGNNDPDGDLVTSEVEATIGSNPLLLDTDSDGFNDATEFLNGTNPASAVGVPGTTRIERVFGFGPARGLDLTGNFLYAFNVGTTGAAGQAGDATFTADNAPGITIGATDFVNVFTNLNFGSTTGDNVLETVYQSIRWANSLSVDPEARKFKAALANLVVGRNYKLQLLFGEAGAAGRRFDVRVNGALLLNDFAPSDAQGSVVPATAGSAIVHEFTASSSILNVVLDGVTDVVAVPGINRDSYLNGATLEEIPTAAPSPTFTPAAGSYPGLVNVTLANNAAGATLRYTINGDTPSDTVGTVYTGPFTLNTSAVVRVIATGGGWLPSSVTSASYTVLPSALASWRTLQGLAANGSQDLANPSGDGVANLLKFAFNMAPNAGALATANTSTLTANGTAGLPLITVDGSGRLVVTFVRLKAVNNPGLTYTVETTDDLTTAWQTLNLTGASVTSIDANWERVSVTDPVISAARFGRVRVQTSGL